MPAESLVPGYKLVETFGPDSEYETGPPVNTEENGDGEEVEEEVEYVTLEISGIADVDPNLLTSYRLIGLDTPTPFLQLSSSGTIFKGRHHNLLGTELLFTHSQGDSDPSARQISLLGMTEKRIVFSPVEVRSPGSTDPPSTSRAASKGKSPEKGGNSSSKKGKKKASLGTGGIEGVAGTLSAGVSKSSAADDQEPVAESGPSSRDKSAGKEKNGTAHEDGHEDVDMTERDDAEGGDLEASLGEGSNAGKETTDSNAGPALRKKRKPTKTDADKDDDSENLSIQGTATTTPSLSVAATPAAQTEPSVTQDQRRGGTTPINVNSDIPMAIDPALETLHVPGKQLPPQGPGT